MKSLLKDPEQLQITKCNIRKEEEVVVCLGPIAWPHHAHASAPFEDALAPYK